jgi:membrane protease subunit HflC
MQAERHRVAKEFRSKGAEEAEIIRAAADKERTIILANAYRDSEKIRGPVNSSTPSGSCQVFMIDYFMFIAGLKWRKNSVFGFSTIISFRPENDFLSTNGNMARTNSRLAQIIKTGLKSEFSI